MMKKDYRDFIKAYSDDGYFFIQVYDGNTGAIIDASEAVGIKEYDKVLDKLKTDNQIDDDRISTNW